MHTLRKLAGDCRRACAKIWDFRSVADAARALWRRCKRAAGNRANWMKIVMVYLLHILMWRANCRDHSGVLFTYMVDQKRRRDPDVLTYSESALFWIALDWSMACVPRLPGDNLTACRIRSATIVFCWKPGEPFSATIESE